MFKSNLEHFFEKFGQRGTILNQNWSNLVEDGSKITIYTSLNWFYQTGEPDKVRLINDLPGHRTGLCRNISLEIPYIGIEDLEIWMFTSDMTHIDQNPEIWVFSTKFYILTKNP